MKIFNSEQRIENRHAVTSKEVGTVLICSHNRGENRILSLIHFLLINKIIRRDKSVRQTLESFLERSSSWVGYRKTASIGSKAGT